MPASGLGAGVRLDVAPVRPDAPGTPFPPVAEDAYDPELESIAMARARPAVVVVAVARALALVAVCALLFALRFDLRFALASRDPLELSPAAPVATLRAGSHRLVSMDAVPGAVGAVDYRRPMGAPIYRLAPLVDHPDIYAELRLGEGVDTTRIVPPTSLRGRLVPLDEGGARFRHVRDLIAEATGHPPPAGAFILEHGATPSLFAPAPAIAAIALAFGVSQLLALARLVRGARPRRPGPTIR